MFGTTFVNLPQITLVKPLFCVWVRVDVLLVLLLCGGEQGMCKHTMGLLLADKHQTVPTMMYTPSYLQGRKYFLVLDPGRKCEVPSRPHILL